MSTRKILIQRAILDVVKWPWAARAIIRATRHVIRWDAVKAHMKARVR